MIPSFIIVFRETLEAALIVGIIFSYLAKINARGKFKQVWFGVGAGIFASIIAAILFNIIAGGFAGISEKIFEGVTFIMGAVLLTTFILWIMKEEQHIKKLEEKVDFSITNKRMLGLFFIVFISILREGIETVIFLQSLTKLQDNIFITWIGAISGAIIAVGAGILIYFGEKKIPLKRFFQVTNIILILFAAGMAAYGIHELQEAKIIPTIIEHVYDINPHVVKEGVYPVLHEKGAIGSIFKGLLGYNGNPSLIEVIAYIAYLLSIFSIWKFVFKKKRN